MTTGGICVSGQAKINKKADVIPAPIEYCPQHQDPMSGFIAPSIGGCTDNAVEYQDQDITLTAGRVFCDGLKITGSSVVTLQPGLYVVDNGKFEIQDDAVLEGEGVTILLYGEKAEFDIKNSARLSLSAPTAGSLQGLLIVQDLGFPWGEEHDVSTKENKWDSDAISELTGVIYLPEGKFTSKVETNITGTSACFVLIASEIKIDGDANLSIDLTGSGCRKTLPTAFSRSVALLD